MHIVAVHNWQREESEVAKIIADSLCTVIFEARQKIAGGGPAVLSNFAKLQPAEQLAAKLRLAGVPAMVIDTEVARSKNQPFIVRRFILEPHVLRLESFSGEHRNLDYSTIELLLVATSISGQMQTGTETKRKFSLGKTLLAGGLPMTKTVKLTKTVEVEVRDETLWSYVEKQAPVIFDRAAMDYDGLGSAMKFTRDLNFSHLKNELKRLAPQACYDDRLLKRASLVRLLGPTLSPETDLDLAFEILSQSLLEKQAS